MSNGEPAGFVAPDLGFTFMAIILEGGF